MIVSGILIGMLGNTAYDIVKNLIVENLDIEENEMIKKIYGCIDLTTKQFFDRYNDHFGKPEDSFLARQENISIILKSLYFDSDIDLKKDLDRRGYAKDIDASDEAIEYFMDTLFTTMKKDIELNNYLTSKKHIIESKLDNQIIIDLLTKLNNNMPIDNKTSSESSNWMIKDQLGNLSKYIPGKPIKVKMERSYAELMIKDDIYYIEFIDNNGLKSYYEVNKKGEIIDFRPPFLLSEYSLKLNSEDVLEDIKVNLGNGYYRRKIKLKWGKTADIIFNLKDEIQQIELKGGWNINNLEKSIKVSE